LYLLILESIGTSELILIGIIALIVFGPRKLPQMAKTIGKTMADFRRTTNEFKSTWEREAEFYKEEKIITPEIVSYTDNSISKEKAVSKTINKEQNAVETPLIKEIEQGRIDQIFSDVKSQKSNEPTIRDTDTGDTENTTMADKRDWL
jgi:Tat protein translocase TatB subunit